MLWRRPSSSINPRYSIPIKALNLHLHGSPIGWRTKISALAWMGVAEHSTIFSLNDYGDPSNTKTYISRHTIPCQNSTRDSPTTSSFIMRIDLTKDSIIDYLLTYTFHGRCLLTIKNHYTLNSLQIGLDNGGHFTRVLVIYLFPKGFKPDTRPKS